MNIISPLRGLTGLVLGLALPACFNLAGDCERLGTCVPADLQVGGGAQLGTSCNDDDTCASGFCVEGICCNTACEGGCGTCVAPGSVGQCQAEVEATCGDGQLCDGGGFCTSGALSTVRLVGTADDDESAPGAILPGVGVLFAGSAAASDLMVGELHSPASARRGFSGVIGDDDTVARPHVWDEATAIEASAGEPGGGMVLGGRFEGGLAVEGLDAWTNTEAADGFVVRVDHGGTPLWQHRLTSSTAKAAHVEAIARDASTVAVAGWANAGGALRRSVRLLDAGTGSLRGEVYIDLGADVALDASVTGLAFDDGGRLWVLAEYRGDGSLQPSGGAVISLPRSSPLPDPPLTRSLLLGVDAAAQVVSGPFLFGETSDVRAGGLAVRGDTLYVGGGLAGGELDVAPAPGTPQVTLVSDDLGHDPFILALDDAGRRRWSAAWPSDAETTTVRSLAVTPTGDVAFAGSVRSGTLDLAGALIASGNEVSFVGKLASNGATVFWATSVAATAGCRLDWVGIADDGRVWVTGAAEGSLLGAPGLGGRDLAVAAFEP